ncbi:MAG: tetratricopeptide repeat protein, partial [Candidatus Aminicenantes bacterium]|nr:tetratricopeptide repeat protein [Candidatus Aminicenantes bacterium]
ADYYYWRDSDRYYNKSIEACQKLLALYPEDNMGNFIAGVIYNNLDEFDQAARHLEVCRRNRYEWRDAYSSLALAYRASGHYDKAQDALEFFLVEVGDSASVRDALAELYLAQGKLEQADQEIDRAMTLDPTMYDNFVTAGNAFLLRGNLAEAEKESDKLFQHRAPIASYFGCLGRAGVSLVQGKFERIPEGMKQTAELAANLGAKVAASELYRRAAYACLRAGKPREAQVECRQALDWAVAADSIFEQLMALHLRGVIELENDSLDAAENTAEQLKALIEASLYKKEIRRYQHLRGLIDLKQKDYSKAIKGLEAAVGSLPYSPLEKDALFLDGLAEAYFASGDLEKARAEYEKIGVLTTGRLDYGDIYVRSFYWLGRIAEQKGLKDRARENYRKFLDLWKDADPGLRVVEDAKKRLGAL